MHGHGFLISFCVRDEFVEQLADLCESCVDLGHRVNIAPAQCWVIGLLHCIERLTQSIKVIASYKVKVFVRRSGFNSRFRHTWFLVVVGANDGPQQSASKSQKHQANMRACFKDFSQTWGCAGELQIRNVSRCVSRWAYIRSNEKTPTRFDRGAIGAKSFWDLVSARNQHACSLTSDWVFPQLACPSEQSVASTNHVVDRREAFGFPDSAKTIVHSRIRDSNLINVKIRDGLNLVDVGTGWSHDTKRASKRNALAVGLVGSDDACGLTGLRRLKDRFDFSDDGRTAMASYIPLAYSYIFGPHVLTSHREASAFRLDELAVVALDHVAKDRAVQGRVGRLASGARHALRSGLNRCVRNTRID